MSSGASALTEDGSRRSRRRPIDPPLLGLALLAVLYLATVLPSLGSDPIAGGDEGWIISSSARLAREGVFGSELFAGFYSVEDHYFFNLPLHHLVLAGVFKVFGVSLLAARLVSVVFGLAALMLTYAVGRRIGGPFVGLGAAALLVLLRLNLAPFSGLTLTDLGATVRYDLITLPFGLGAVLLLLRKPEAPSTTAAALAGLLVGLAALTQFIGAFLAPPLALFLLTAPGARRRRLLLTAAFALTLLLPFLPYFGYIAANWQDFRGQARAVEQRTDFLSPSFYSEQLGNEPERYQPATALEDAPDSPSALLERPSARLALLLVGPLAIVYTVWRGRRERPRLLVAMLLVALVLEMALFESTKRFVYWIVVVPYLCVAIADLGLWAWQARAAGPRLLLPRAAVGLVAAVFLVEGLAVAARDVRDAPDAVDYAALGRELEAVLPEGSVSLGDNRLWPALEDRNLRSFLLLFYHTNPGISEERTTTLTGALERIDPDYVLMSPLSREILGRLTAAHAAELERFIATRTELVTRIENPAYGPIEVYRVRR